MARVTTSGRRSRGRARIPVTGSAGRRNRQGASRAVVTQGSNGRPTRVPVVRNRPGQGASGPPVTTDRQRGRNTGNANVTRGAGARPELPAAGGSSGNTDRARLQQGWVRDRGARATAGRTLENMARGTARLLGLDRQSQAQARAAAAARGTRGEGTRVVPPGGSNPGSRPQLPPGRSAGALPPGRQGGALAGRPAGGQLATRPGAGQLATRGSSALATRPSGTPVDGRLVGVNVAEIGRRPRLEGQRALPPGQQALPAGGQRALPPGRPGGALATRGGSRPGGSRPGGSRPGGGGALATRGGSNPGSRPQLSGSNTRGRLPGGTGGAAQNGQGRGNNARAQAVNGALQSRGGVVGGALSSIGYGIALGLLQPKARQAGQWLGRNVLLPFVDRYEDRTPGTQSDRERRRQIAREGGRQGPPVPERLRRAPARGSSDTSRPSRSGGSNYSPPAAAAGRPQRAQASAAAATQTRPQGSSSRPASAPPGMNSDPLQGRNGSWQTEGSPLTIEPAPLPDERPQAPVTGSSPRPSATETRQQPSFRGPGAAQPLPETAAAQQKPSDTPAGTSTAPAAQSPAAAPSSGQSERPAANSRLAIPSRGPTGREEMITYNIARAKRKRKPAAS